MPRRGELLRRTCGRSDDIARCRVHAGHLDVIGPHRLAVEGAPAENALPAFAVATSGRSLMFAAVSVVDRNVQLVIKTYNPVAV